MLYYTYLEYKYKGTKLTTSMINRLAGIQSVEGFWINFINNLLTELLMKVVLYQQILNYNYLLSSDSFFDYKFFEKKFEVLNNNIRNREEIVNELKEKNEALLKTKESSEKDNVHLLSTLVKQHSKNIDELNQENEKLKSRLEDLEKLLELQQQEENIDVQKYDLNILAIKYFVFVGGRPEVILELQRKLYNSTFIANIAAPGI